ncbi:MAG: T9SS type A sorting domain-containing protein [Cyclobacteriaceae bacterium]|nr:T9SS type A sorting domain-containing protein [Cyclobacteriaceae bacterium]
MNIKTSIFIACTLVFSLHVKAQLCFSSSVNYSAGTQPIVVISADFNNDSKPDVATVNIVSNTVSVLLGDGSGMFYSAINYTVASNPGSLTAADFNMDGNIDIAVQQASGTGTVSILLGSGTGTFTPGTSVIAPPGASIANADFNMDGKVDLVVAKSNGFSFLQGNGMGGFGSPTGFTFTGSSSTSMIALDLNTDGKVDVAEVYNGSGSSYFVSVFWGDGLGGFSAPIPYAVGSSAQTVVGSDFNNDSKIDLAVSNTSDANISVLLNDGSGSFYSAVNFTTLPNVYGLTSDDFNNDGNMDLAVTGLFGTQISILLGNGTGSFGTGNDFFAGSNPYSIISADFNTDGNSDLAVANQAANNVSILLNLIPSTPTISQAGSTLTSSSATGNQWYLNGTLISGATSQVYTAVSNGTYTVIVTTGGCASAPSAPIFVTVLYVEDAISEIVLDIYPNPSNGLFDLTLINHTSTDIRLAIYNALGAVILEEELTATRSKYFKHIDLSKYPKGFYIFHVSTNQYGVTRKVIVN